MTGVMIGTLQESIGGETAGKDILPSSEIMESKRNQSSLLHIGTKSRPTW